MINARERIHDYRAQGLQVQEGFDKPGTVYEWHAHERTILYTVAGSVLLERKGKEPLDLEPGSEVVIETNEQHHGVVGPQGWKYVAAFNADEAAQFKH